MDTCSSEAMDYNALPPIQTVIQQSKYVEYPCLNGLSSDSNVPLEFRIERSGQLTDLRQIYLVFGVRVRYADGSDLPDNVDVAPVNNWGYSLFSGIDVYIQDRKISNSDGYYAYMAYVNLLLHTTKNEKKYYLKQAMWVNDEGSFMDRIGRDEAGVSNQGFIDRGVYIMGSHEAALMSKLMFDFNIAQLIPDGTEIFLRFNRNEASKCLLAEDGKEYKISITRAKLLVLQVSPTDVGRAEIPRSIQIPATRYYTMSRFVAKGVQNVDFVPWTGILPRRLYFFQSLSSAYNGAISKNMFRFEVFDMKRITLYKNGESVPVAQGIDVMDNDAALLYTLSLNALNRTETAPFDCFDFKWGFFVATFDLTRDMSAGRSNYNSPTENGTIRITVDYRTPLDESITIFCMLELPATLQVDEDRNCKWLS